MTEKSHFLKKIFRNTIRVSNSLDLNLIIKKLFNLDLYTCTDPESFFSRGPTLTKAFFLLMRRERGSKTTKNRPLSALQRNAI